VQATTVVKRERKNGCETINIGQRCKMIRNLLELVAPCVLAMLVGMGMGHRLKYQLKTCQFS
jgi:hypothetical protein